MICPCKDCDDRNISCHINCKKYIDWKKWHDKAMEKERKAFGRNPISYGGWVRTNDGYWRRTVKQGGKYNE